MYVCLRWVDWWCLPSVLCVRAKNKRAKEDTLGTQTEANEAICFLLTVALALSRLLKMEHNAISTSLLHYFTSHWAIELWATTPSPCKERYLFWKEREVSESEWASLCVDWNYRGIEGYVSTHYHKKITNGAIPSFFSSLGREHSTNAVKVVGMRTICYLNSS